MVAKVAHTELGYRPEVAKRNRDWTWEFLVRIAWAVKKDRFAIYREELLSFADYLSRRGRSVGALSPRDVMNYLFRPSTVPGLRAECKAERADRLTDFYLFCLFRGAAGQRFSSRAPADDHFGRQRAGSDSTVVPTILLKH